MFTGNNTSIIKADPRTKLLILVISMIIPLKCVTVFPSLVFAALLCVMLFLEGEKYLSVICFCISIIIMCLYAGAVKGGFGSVLNMICMSVMVLIRFFCPITMALLLFTKTTDMSHLISSFQKMHLPMVFVIPFVVLIRFIPTIFDEWDGIKKAMLFRGIEFKLKSFITKPAQIIEYTMVPLLFCSVELMDELASSAMARGLDSNRKRSSYVEARLRVTDYSIILIFAGFLAYMFFIYQQ